MQTHVHKTLPKFQVEWNWLSRLLKQLSSDFVHFVLEPRLWSEKEKRSPLVTYPHIWTWRRGVPHFRKDGILTATAPDARTPRSSGPWPVQSNASTAQTANRRFCCLLIPWTKMLLGSVQPARGWQSQTILLTAWLLSGKRLTTRYTFTLLMFN